MHVSVQPTRYEALAGTPAVFIVEILNTAEVISAYSIRVLGLDPAWVEVDNDRLSLFPEVTGIATVTIRLPDALPAGTRRVGIRVTSLVDPNLTQLVEVDLVVPAVRQASLRLEPTSVTGASTAGFGLLLANDGNTPLDIGLEGSDPEAKVRFRFDPARALVQPGDQLTVHAEARGRRPFAGTPKARVLTFRAHGPEPVVEAAGSFIQRPFLSRSMLSLVGLLLAISVFAVVLTNSLGDVVEVSKVDEGLLLQALEEDEKPGAIPDNPGTVAGTVTLLTSGRGVSGVTVEVFSAGDPVAPVRSTVTADDGVGSFQVPTLDEGTYKLRIRGAGFTEIWYPNAVDFASAKEVDVALGEVTDGLDVRLGGVPGSIAGDVIGEEPDGAVVSLKVPAAQIGSVTDSVVSITSVDATGAFLLEEVPAPSSYVLSVEKPGFATENRVVNLGAGEKKDGIEINLRKGDGSISGQVFSGEGPVGGAVITATEGDNVITTVSLTTGEVGAFTLRNLATPAAYTLTISKDGFAAQTVAVFLSRAQQLTGVTTTLTSGTGSISGVASVQDEGPSGGISVTVTGGEVTRTTFSLSQGDVGAWSVAGLPVPGTYTVTFSGEGLASQTRSIDLDALANSNAVDVNATLTRGSAAIEGTVFGEGEGPIGEAAVTLTDGTFVLRTTSASSPLGRYRLQGIPPGTYTVTFQRSGSNLQSALVSLGAGQTLAPFDVTLERRASISGQVLLAGRVNHAGIEVRLFRVACDADELGCIPFPGLPPLATVVTPDDGRYSFPNLAAPKNYVLEYAFPAGTLARASRTVPVDAGQQLVVPTVTIQTSGAGS